MIRRRSAGICPVSRRCTLGCSGTFCLSSSVKNTAGSHRCRQRYRRCRPGAGAWGNSRNLARRSGWLRAPIALRTPRLRRCHCGVFGVRSTTSSCDEITCRNPGAACAFPVAGIAHGATDEGMLSKEASVRRRKMLQIGRIRRIELREEWACDGAWRRQSTRLLSQDTHGYFFHPIPFFSKLKTKNRRLALLAAMRVRPPSCL